MASEERPGQEGLIATSAVSSTIGALLTGSEREKEMVSFDINHASQAPSEDAGRHRNEKLSPI